MLPIYLQAVMSECSTAGVSDGNNLSLSEKVKVRFFKMGIMSRTWLIFHVLIYKLQFADVFPICGKEEWDQSKIFSDINMYF